MADSQQRTIDVDSTGDSQRERETFPQGGEVNSGGGAKQHPFGQTRFLLDWGAT